jgi:hypothetical protein
MDHLLRKKKKSAKPVVYLSQIFTFYLQKHSFQIGDLDKDSLQLEELPFFLISCEMHILF